MITQNCMDAVLPIVADSWEKLRGIDVDRLLNSIDYESLSSLNEAAEIVKKKRPDLLNEVENACWFIEFYLE